MGEGDSQVLVRAMATLDRRIAPDLKRKAPKDATGLN